MQGITHFLFYACLCGICLLSAISAPADAADPKLIAALKQATYDENSKRTDLNALVWLSDMSERLEDRISDPFYRIRLLSAVDTEAERAGLDPQLVLAVMDIESDFNRYAHSRSGAQGLMQIMPFWKEIYGNPNDDLYNPMVSLRYGCTILRHYMDKYSNRREALAAYNGSLGRSTYPDKILRRLESRWQFKADRYAPADEPKVAIDEFPESGISEHLVLN